MRVRILFLSALITLAASNTLAQLPKLSFTQSVKEIEVNDFIEVTITVANPNVANPFTDVTINGRFQTKGEAELKVDGFCDAPDGSVYRIRFLPTKPGQYAFLVNYKQGNFVETFSGRFQANASQRRGIVRVDKAYPWHFLWEGTGEHYFWNATTTYWLMGWDEETMLQNVDRLAKLKVNRLRVAMSGRVKDGRAWMEDVFESDKFKFRLNPWVAANPDSLETPGFDVTRYNLAFWQKYERLLAFARARDVNISVVFYVDGSRPGADPFGLERAGGADEQRYYRYSVARFAAYSNVMWDVTNEYRTFRNDAWAEKMGAFLKDIDPYKHLQSVHGHGDFRFRQSAWADFAMYQNWDECGGYMFMANNRVIQTLMGRIIPQVNEEYGYEDHYPTWGCGQRVAPQRDAESRRRLAWEMTMAGTYQTTGERAAGWINGKGTNDTMLKFYGHLVDFFTSIEWWKLEPNNPLMKGWGYCLAEPGKQYVIYLLHGGKATITLEPGKYRATWINPRNGERKTIAEEITGTSWTSPNAADGDDWILLLARFS